MLVKDENGNEIEVFSQEELQAKITEATKPLQDDLSKLKTDLDAAIAAGGSDKDENIKKMREAINAKDAQIADITKQLGELPGKMQANALAESKEEMLTALVGKDEDLKKKVQFFLDEFKTQPTDKKSLKHAVEYAYILATGGQKPTPGILDNGATHGGYPGGGYQHKAADGDYLQNETPNQKAMRNVFGISDEDAKKFGKN